MSIIIKEAHSKLHQLNVLESQITLPSITDISKSITDTLRYVSPWGHLRIQDDGTFLRSWLKVRNLRNARTAEMPDTRLCEAVSFRAGIASSTSRDAKRIL